MLAVDCAIIWPNFTLIPAKILKKKIKSVAMSLMWSNIFNDFADFETGGFIKKKQESKYLDKEVLFGTKYSRMDQVKFVEDSL